MLHILLRAMSKLWRGPSSKRRESLCLMSCVTITIELCFFLSLLFLKKSPGFNVCFYFFTLSIGTLSCNGLVPNVIEDIVCGAGASLL